MFKDYEKLLLRIDSHCSGLDEVYKGQLLCKKGCSFCCLPGLTLFPIEAFFIASKMKSKKGSRSQTKCCYLKNKACEIYKWRPIVCRTQGYPLLYASLEGKGIELSHCELNFENFNEDFKGNQIISMENINTMLAVINMEFLKKIGKFEEMKNLRIPMKSITSYRL